MLPRAILGPRAPDPIEVGGGTVLLLEGTIDPGPRAIGELRIRLGAIEREVDASGVRAAGSVAGTPRRWWALVPIPAGTPSGPVSASLLASSDGDELELSLGEVEIATDPPTGGGADLGVMGDQIGVTGAGVGEQPLIAVCMATFEPPADRLRLQLASIRAQSWERWICLISDDGSSPAAFAELERAIEGDRRFVVSRSPERLGFLRNFERAIQMAPAEAELFALADQDDRWYPDKLEALAGTLHDNPQAALAYSDMRITDGAGAVLADTYWYLRRNRFDDIASLLVANVVTGAASLFRRSLLDDALPFPPAHPTQALYHDHWLALCALAGGEIAYLDRPTYDYFRHDDSVTVREAPRWLRPEAGRLGRLRLHWGRMTRRLRMGSAAPSFEAVYLDRWLLICQLVQTLDLRLGRRVGSRHRRTMERLLSAERSPLGAAWLLGRCLRPLIGRNETLARERVLLGGLIWRRTAGSLLWRRGRES